MKSPLLVALAVAPLACAGTQTTPASQQAPVAPPVVVDLTPPPAAAPAPSAKAEAPKQEPAADAKPAEEADVGGNSLAEHGMIGLLNSSAGGDPNAPTAPWGRDDALGNDPLSARGTMWGSDIGESFGAGGLGLVGIGETDGKGSGVGIGLGGIGQGHGRLGGAHRANPPKVRMGAVTVTGRLPPEVVQRIVRQNFGRFRLCYENGLRDNARLTGKVTIKFVIDKDGMVSSVSNAGSDLPNAGVVSCVTRAFLGLSFPQPEAGKVNVVYPITFSPGDPAPSGTSATTASSTAPTPPSAPAPAKPAVTTGSPVGAPKAPPAKKP